MKNVTKGEYSMIKLSEASEKILLDKIYDEIVSSDLGICLVKKETINQTSLDILADRCKFPNKFGIFCYDNTRHFGGHILYVGYSSQNDNNKDLLDHRINAIYALFDRWNKKGYNTRKAKDPFKSSRFQKYIDEKLCYMECDYVILATEWS